MRAVALSILFAGSFLELAVRGRQVSEMTNGENVTAMVIGIALLLCLIGGR